MVACPFNSFDDNRNRTDLTGKSLHNNNDIMNF